MNIASFNGLEKKIRDIFFDMPIEVGQYLVMLLALAADGLSVDVLLNTNWIKAVGSCLYINRIETVTDKEKIRLKQLPNPFEDFIGAGFIMCASERVKVTPGGFTVCEVDHCPVP